MESRYWVWCFKIFSSIDMNHLRTIKEAVNLISLEYEVLKNTLPDYVGDVEEDVVSTFNSAFLLLPKLLRLYSLPYSLVIEMLEINTLLYVATLDQDAPLDFFKESQVWKDIRSKAKGIAAVLSKVEEKAGS